MATYVLTINPNQGYWKQSNMWSTQIRTINVAEDTAISIANPVRKGYKFLYWNLSNDTCYISGDRYVQGTGNCTAVARWAPDPAKDNWNAEISKVFREPGDFRYQLVSGKMPEIFTDSDNIEGQWSYGVPLSGSIFKKIYITTVGNGSWILDGSLASVCEDNVFRYDASGIARRYSLPAEWVISSMDGRWLDIGSIPNDSGILSIVWDVTFRGFPTFFTVQGFNFISAEEIEVIWTLPVIDNTNVISTVDVSGFRDLAYDCLRVIAWTWNHSGYTPPTLTAIYFGYTEDSETSTKGILNVKHSTSTNLYSNELSTQNITIENSNLSYYRDVNRDLLLESNLPGNSLIFAQYGLTYPDGNIYYSDVYTFSTSKYSAPTDTQTITIEGTDLLATGTDVFQFNYIFETATASTLDDIIMRTYYNNNMLTVDEVNWPSEIYDEALVTYSMGALPKDTTVNQTYQYIAQILGAVVYTDMVSGYIKAKKVEDLVIPVPYELNQDITTSWPAITLNTQINRIDIKKYKVRNTHEDLYGVVYSTHITVPKNFKDTSGQWHKEYVSLLFGNTPLDFNGPKDIRVTKSNKDDTTPFNYTVGHIGMDTASLWITYQSTTQEGQFNIEVIGYPGYPVFDTQNISGSVGEIITVTKSWDNAKRGVGVMSNSALEIRTNLAGAYYCKVEVQLLKNISASNPVVLEFFGADVEITSEIVTYWDNTDNAAGEILTIDNPLISTDYVLNKVGAFIKGLILNRKHYKLDYLGDPTLNAMDTRKVLTDHETLDNFIITKSEINFNGGYSGTIEGRTL